MLILLSYLKIFHTPLMWLIWAKLGFSNNDFKNKSQYNLPNYISIPFERKVCKKAKVIVIYIINDLEYKIRNDLSISNYDSGSFVIEITIENASNFIIFLLSQTSKYGFPDFHITF